MISVQLGGDLYHFSNGDWYGFSRGERSEYSSLFPGAYTRAPLCIYPKLLSVALEQGYDSSDFYRKREEEEDIFDDNTEETEKPKSRKSRRAKKKSNSISIF